MDSGLYAALASAGLIVEHEEAPLTLAYGGDASVILRPRMLPFISYPYEWCFSQLKEAALLTLEIQKRALEHDLSLKDASAYNIQFDGVRAIFIDTLSFEEYREGAPWIAYGQFCRHFLAPLAIMAYADARLGKLSEIHLDGLPLDIASRLLPWTTRLHPGLLMHLHLHAKAQTRHITRQPLTQPTPSRRMSRLALRGLVDSLESAVGHLTMPKQRTIWSDYYDHTSYSSEAVARKQAIVAGFLDRIRPATVWDLGANTGAYSEVAAAAAQQVMACDSDIACVETAFRNYRERGLRNILPLWIDLTNPSPGRGWAHAERASLADRGPADAVMALALVHHLAIGNNVPLSHIAEFFRRLSRNLIIEFVPKDDPQTQRLLVSREDIFTGYSREQFEMAFEAVFSILDVQMVPNSDRAIYLMAGT